MLIPGGKAFQAEGTASARALRQEHAGECEASEAGAHFADKETEAQGHCLRKLERVSLIFSL